MVVIRFPNRMPIYAPAASCRHIDMLERGNKYPTLCAALVGGHRTLSENAARHAPESLTQPRILAVFNVGFCQHYNTGFGAGQKRHSFIPTQTGDVSIEDFK